MIKLLFIGLICVLFSSCCYHSQTLIKADVDKASYMLISGEDVGTKVVRECDIILWKCHKGGEK